MNRNGIGDNDVDSGRRKLVMSPMMGVGIALPGVVGCAIGGPGRPVTGR